MMMKYRVAKRSYVTRDGVRDRSALESSDCEARSGGRGRKLQDPAGRAATRVKISDSNFCWTLVS